MSEILSPLANRCRTLANEWQQMAADTGEHQYAECAASLYALLAQIGNAPAKTCSTCHYKRPNMRYCDRYAMSLLPMPREWGCNVGWEALG